MKRHKKTLAAIALAVYGGGMWYYGFDCHRATSEYMEENPPVQTLEYRMPVKDDVREVAVWRI